VSFLDGSVKCVITVEVILYSGKFMTFSVLVSFMQS
jgi:hypothetical protein